MTRKQTNNQNSGLLHRRDTYVCPARNHGALLPGDFLPDLHSAGPCGLVKADNTKTCLREEKKKKENTDLPGK